MLQAWDLLARKLAGLVAQLWALLENWLLQAGGLEPWMLQAWDLLAKKLAGLVAQLWALPFLSKEYISSRGEALSVPYPTAFIFLCKIKISRLNP